MVLRPSALWRGIPPVAIALGFASLLTDLSSEMIYPLLPLFLTVQLGAGAVALGVIEGTAESISALLKLVSGWWADKVQRRTPFVIAGYGLAGFARPLIGLASAWPAVFALRFADRIGKGLRTAPRDALLAESAGPHNRGRVFGFHRAMDHAGAVFGPLVAAALMAVGLSLSQVFLAAAVPAALVMVVLIARVRDVPRPVELANPAARPDLAQSGRLGGEFWRLMLAVFVFTLGNSTDAFLLLRLADAGLSATWIAALWSAHHMVKLAAVYLFGSLSDRVGRHPLIIAGWMLYLGTYIAFAATTHLPVMVLTFLVYGLYYGLTEPVERAWVTDLAPATLRATALGVYHAAIGLGALPASLVFGAIYQTTGAPYAFGFGALCAALALILLLAAPRKA